MENNVYSGGQEPSIDFCRDIPNSEVQKELGLDKIQSTVDFHDLVRANPDQRYTLIGKYKDVNGCLLGHLRNAETGDEFLARTEDGLQFPLRPVKEYHLSDHDTEMVRTGLTALKELLGKLPPEQLPVLIVYPDVAARPLRMATEPVLRDIYGRAGKQLPHQVFFATHMAALNEVMKAGRAQFRQLAEDKPELVQQAMADRTAMLARAQEIIASYHLNDSTPIMFIDDYASPRRNTQGRLCDVFRAQLPQIPIIGYAFSGRPAAVSQYYDDHIGKEEAREMPFGIQLGFDYRRDPDIEAAVTGVGKTDGVNNFQHSQRIDQAEYESTVAIEFRKELQAIGEEVASMDARL